jgi:hypothetical protein
MGLMIVAAAVLILRVFGVNLRGLRVLRGLSFVAFVAQNNTATSMMVPALL